MRTGNSNGRMRADRQHATERLTSILSSAFPTLTDAIHLTLRRRFLIRSHCSHSTIHNVLFTIFLSLFALYLSFTSCTGRQTPRLDSLDSMLDTDAHSATAVLAALDSIEHGASQPAPRALTMRISLLRAKAMNKAYINFTSDSAAKAVARYYSSHGTKAQRVEAYYLLGCAYRDLGMEQHALDWYERAAGQADTTAADCDWEKLYVVYAQMFAVYNTLRLPDRQLECLARMEQCARHYGNRFDEIICTSHKMRVYDNMGDTAKMIATTYTADSLLRAEGYAKEAASVWGGVIYTLLRRGQADSAKHYIDIYESSSGNVGPDGVTLRGYELFYVFKGMYYLQKDMHDSAGYYFRKAITGYHTPSTLEGGLRGLLSLYEKTHRADSMAKYAQLICAANDSNQHAASTIEAQRVKSMYDYSRNKALAQEKAAEAERTRWMLIIVSLTAVIAVGTTVWLYGRHKRRARQRLNDINRKYAQALTEYSRLKAELSLTKAAGSHISAENEAEINRLRQQIAGMQEDYRHAYAAIDADNLTADADVISMHQFAISGPAPDALWNTVVRKVKATMPEFTGRISNRQAGLTQQEKDVCMLLKLHFINSEITNLMNITPQRLTNIKANINSKLFGQSGAKTLNNNLRRI